MIGELTLMCALGGSILSLSSGGELSHIFSVLILGVSMMLMMFFGGVMIRVCGIEGDLRGPRGLKEYVEVAARTAGFMSVSSLLFSGLRRFGVGGRE